MNFTGIMIGTEDPSRLVAYYTKVFGDPAWSDGGFTGWEFGQAGVFVGAHDQVKGSNDQPGRIIWNLETPDVQSDFERFQSAGAIVVQEPYNPEGDDSGTMRVATFADPDGNYFQLVSPM